MSIIKGVGIEFVQTLGSQLDMNSIEVRIDGIHYRLKANLLKDILAELFFKTEKKRVHTYLIPILDGADDPYMENPTVREQITGMYNDLLVKYIDLKREYGEN